LGWTIEFTEAALKRLARLDKPVARRIVDFMEQRVGMLDDPRALGESLKGPRLGNFWKYRVGDWRIVCDLQDQRVVVQVVKIGNRREVYRDPS
jgi:mRNA interferase RelE/StbE